MDNLDNKRPDMPYWLLKEENYIPKTDKDAFVNKSILSLLKVISRIKMQDFADRSKSSANVWLKANIWLKVLFTFILILLVSITKSFIFVIVVITYLLLTLSMMDADRLVKIIKMALGVTLFTAVIMLPALFLGNGYSSVMITSKVCANITAIGLLSYTAKWSAITEALKRFHVPDIFILILDIAIKYMYMLGEFSLNMLYALKLRSVGRNRDKYSSMAGIAGTMFLQSKEMAEDMYHAMECRGFSGEYHICNKTKITPADCLYIALNIGFIILFIYFEGI